MVPVPPGSGIGVFGDIGLFPRDTPVTGPKNPGTEDPVVSYDWVASADYDDSGIARNDRDRAYGKRGEVVSDGRPAASTVRTLPDAAACSSGVDHIGACGIEGDRLNPARKIRRSTARLGLAR